MEILFQPFQPCFHRMVESALFFGDNSDHLTRSRQLGINIGHHLLHQHDHLNLVPAFPTLLPSYGGICALLRRQLGSLDPQPSARDKHRTSSSAPTRPSKSCSSLSNPASIVWWNLRSSSATTRIT